MKTLKVWLTFTVNYSHFFSTQKCRNVYDKNSLKKNFEMFCTKTVAVALVN